jgi:hypothetical protein
MLGSLSVTQYQCIDWLLIVFIEQTKLKTGQDKNTPYQIQLKEES